MKPINNNNNNTNNANWLGFSLSSHINNMESPSHVSTSIPPNFFHSQVPQHLNNTNSSNNNNSSYGHVYYGGAHEGENGTTGLFYSSLPIMPLKSDGSLCLMEAFTKPHSQATTMLTTSTPKLEDFFGGVTMGDPHNYETNDRQTMALTLHSNNMYYHHQHQHQHQDHEHEHDNDRQQQLDQVQQYHHYSDNTIQNPYMGIDGIMKNGSESSGSNITTAMPYGDLQSLTLSMSPGSQSSSLFTAPHQQISPSVTDSTVIETRKRGPEKVEYQKQIVHRKSIDTFGQRTSQYRGVTRHRWTGRYEAHLWDNSCKKEGQSRKGRQVYLGGYDMEEKAARAYDLAALKYWGPTTHINFPLENYQKEIEEMKNMTRQEYVAHLRRKSSGFSRGASIYRGVTRHHQHGRWQARIGRVAGNKDLYLGTFSTQEEAAEAYDIAAIKFRGVNAVTNFDITRYDVERIMASNTLLAGELARRNKDVGICNVSENQNNSAHCNNVEVIPTKNYENEAEWKMFLDQPPQQLEHQKSSEVVDGYRSHGLSLTAENVIGLDHINSSINQQQQQIEDSTKMGMNLSNASSLVTSVSNSREGSPDRGNMPMPFGMPPSAAAAAAASKLYKNTSWMIPSAQLRPNLSFPHMPVFTAWTDA